MCIRDRYVIDLAALPFIPDSYYIPKKFFEVNVNATIDLALEISKNKKTVSNAVAHIKASFNNTIINITDPNGETIVWTSGGSVGFKGARKSTPYAAQVAAEEAARRAIEFGVHKLEIIINIIKPTIHIK